MLKTDDDFKKAHEANKKRKNRENLFTKRNFQATEAR